MKKRCPICGKVIDRALREQARREKFYPFCSKRCKLIDLGKWLDSDYRIVAQDKDEEQKNTEAGGQKTEDG
jgi:hypothetical protein